MWTLVPDGSADGLVTFWVTGSQSRQMKEVLPVCCDDVRSRGGPEDGAGVLTDDAPEGWGQHTPHAPCRGSPSRSPPSALFTPFLWPFPSRTQPQTS